MLLTETDISVDDFQSYVLHRQERKRGSKRNCGVCVCVCVCVWGGGVYIRDKDVSNDTLIFTSEDDIL